MAHAGVGPLRRRAIGAVRVAAAAAIAGLAGCGIGAGRAPQKVRLTVTRDFGARVVLDTRAPRTGGEETVMSLLMRNGALATRYGGGFVESIDGYSGGRKHGEGVDWMYYVNGTQAPLGAAETVVHAGDRIWWDLHDWSQTRESAAVVGSFPQPFVGAGGAARPPVDVECIQPSSAACQTAVAHLRAAGACAGPAPVASPPRLMSCEGAPQPSRQRARAAALALRGRSSPATALRVVVGPFRAIATREPAVRQLELGPRGSGVYARFSPSGSALALLDARGRTVRTLSAGAGLVAATDAGDGHPLWVLTGTDLKGATRAADALSEAALHDRFALALTSRGVALALPEEG